MVTMLSPGVYTNEYNITNIVPSVSTSVGALAGVYTWGPINEPVLISSEPNYANIFGKPNSNNYQTWFTGANFLDYTNAIYVVRTANTTAAANSGISALNAYGNVAAIANTPVILNNDDFVSKQGSFDSNVPYVARYPGAGGNSLRVSVCDSASAFSSNLVLSGNVSGVVCNTSLTVNSGSNNVVFTITSANTTSANTYAATLASELSINDKLLVGNSTIGFQSCQIQTISNVASGQFTVNLIEPFYLATNFVANTTTANAVTRVWEFANVVGSAPITSTYVNQFGNSNAIDTMSIVVVDTNGFFSGQPGSILEKYVNVSRAIDAQTEGGQSNYYQTIINGGSQYIWVTNDLGPAPSAQSLQVSSSLNAKPTNLPLINGTDGASESNVALGVVASGYDKLVSTDDYPDISLVMQGRPLGGTTVVGDFIANNFGLGSYIINNFVNIRKDSVAFITPDDSIVTNNQGLESSALVAWTQTLPDSSYAVVDSGYKYQYDKYNNVYRWVPLNGDIAGLCARTDATNAPWWSPAGINRGQISNVVKLRYNPRLPDRDLLYINSINPVVTMRGQGTFLYGDKTFLSEPSAFDRINVRRLFIVLEQAISLAAKYSLFEFNDSFTQSQFVNMVTPYLRTIKGARGIIDFDVICDSTNNPPAIVDANEFVGDIYIKPARSINFIQLNFIAVATGVQFNTVVGTF